MVSSGSEKALEQVRVELQVLKQSSKEAISERDERLRVLEAEALADKSEMDNLKAKVELLTAESESLQCQLTS
jgi:hypothetical protein